MMWVIPPVTYDGLNYIPVVPKRCANPSTSECGLGNGALTAIIKEEAVRKQGRPLVPTADVLLREERWTTGMDEPKNTVASKPHKGTRQGGILPCKFERELGLLTPRFPESWHKSR